MLELLSPPIDSEQTHTVHSLESIRKTAAYLIKLARFQSEHLNQTSAPNLPSVSENGEWSSARWSFEDEAGMPTNVLALGFSKDAFTLAVHSRSFKYTLVSDSGLGIDVLSESYPPKPRIKIYDPIDQDGLQSFGTRLDNHVYSLEVPADVEASLRAAA